MKSQDIPFIADLSSVMPADSATLEILHPVSGKPLGWSITFAGPGHAKAVAWSNEAARETLRRNAQIEAQQINGRKVKPVERDVDEARRENVRWVVARILDWTPVTLEAGGSPIIFSEQAATDLLIKPELSWVYVQMLEFLNDERSFMRASPKV